VPDRACASPGSPAFRAGVHPGDVITSIDGTAASGMSSDDVANRLKGPRGTKVNVTMTRVGASSPINFDLVRDEIPNNSIDLAYEIKPDIGYIHIRQFQETTGREFDDAVSNFGPNLKGLVLDLRGNPGGVLVEAVSVCDRLLKRGRSSFRSAGGPSLSRFIARRTAMATASPSWCW